PLGNIVVESGGAIDHPRQGDGELDRADAKSIPRTQYRLSHNRDAVDERPVAAPQVADGNPGGSRLQGTVLPADFAGDQPDVTPFVTAEDDAAEGNRQ